MVPCQPAAAGYNAALVTQLPTGQSDASDASADVSAAPAATSDAKEAGRGFLWVAGGKVVFIVLAFGVQLALPRLFGSQAAFGLFAVAFGAASMLNNVLIASTVQTVSKLVSEDESRAGETLRRGLTLQLGIGTLLGGALTLSAPILAEHVLLDSALTPLIQIAGAVVFAYALYAALVGYLNGRRRFSHQAKLDMSFSVLRTAGLVGGALLGFGALGSMAGFGIAALTILGIALLGVGIGKRGEAPPLSRWIAFMAPIWIYQLALNGMLQIDLQVLKRTATALLVADRDLTMAAAAEITNALAGTYSAAQRFAFVPYQLILSVTFIVFPYVSKATALDDAETTQRTIRAAMRFSLLVLLSLATPIGGAASGVLRIAYPEAYVAGADALQILVFGQVAFALFVIGATILSGGGKPTVAAVIAVLSVIVVIVSVRVAIGLVGVEGTLGAGTGALRATAIGTSIGTSVSLVAVAITVYRSFGAFIPLLTLARGLLAGCVGFGVARVVPHETRIMAVVALAAGFFAYGLALIAMREIGGRELGALKKILRRG